MNSMFGSRMAVGQWQERLAISEAGDQVTIWTTKCVVQAFLQGLSIHTCGHG